jgi:hexosaminidase
MVITRRPAARVVAALALAGSLPACRSARSVAPTPRPAPVVVGRPAPVAPLPPLLTLRDHRVVPMPTSVTPDDSGAPFTLAAATTIVVPTGSAEAARVGEALATMLRSSTGYRLPVVVADGAGPRGAIVLRLAGAGDAEGYELTVGADSVRLVATSPAGLFHGAETLRQLLPAGIEAEQSVLRLSSAWTVPPGRIVDRPRFAWRGAMLDVARHFFSVGEVEQLIDVLALYKLNTLHLHLSDDQGWRIQIDSWPRLATVGGSTQVGGGRGGYYTKADYAEIVRYAADRYVTIVPEIDMPAHTNAAIAAYPALGCSRPSPDTMPGAPAPGLYTGIRVGWSALCPERAETYAFIDSVIGELAAMTPGPFIHIGGDEVQALTHEQYAAFMARAQDAVVRRGKRAIGWDEIGRAPLRAGTVAQMWRSDTSMAAARQGAKLVMSPATKAYVDMKYTPVTEVGHRWAAFIELRTAYDWDPVTHFKGVTESDVLGVEAALWTETVQNITAAEYLLMPRLPALAEVGWSATSTRDWESFRTRIAAHAPRWRLLGVNYYPSPQVGWQ